MSKLIADFGVRSTQPVTVGGVNTNAAQYFNQPNLAPFGAGYASNNILYVPGANLLNGQPFTVRAAGNFTPAAAAGSETVNVVLYAVTGQSTGSAPTFSSPVYTAIADIASYAPGVDGIPYTFNITANLQGDSDTGILGGRESAFVNNSTQHNNQQLINSITGLNFATAGPPFGFAVGVTFSVGNIGNRAKLFKFTVSLDD